MTTMQKYEGTKRLGAKPMTLGDYNAYRGWNIPANEDPAAPGYLVEYEDGGTGNHPGHVGYISWSPKDVFERTYKPVAPIDPKRAPRQQRMVAEEAELATKLTALAAFTQGLAFRDLPRAEQERLYEQASHMTAYLNVLRARIAAF